jgi:hypothetical protein
MKNELAFPVDTSTVSLGMDIGGQGIELLYEHFDHCPAASPFFSDR